jgi:3-methyladenine DNA glycosylase Tag
LSWDVIEQALASSAVGDRPAPDLRDREWAVVGEGHYQAYLQAVAIVRPPDHRSG